MSKLRKVTSAAIRLVRHEREYGRLIEKFPHNWRIAVLNRCWDKVTAARKALREAVENL